MPTQITSPRDGGRVAEDPMSEARPLDTPPNPTDTDPRRPTSLALVGAATMTSGGIAVFADCERGGMLIEQFTYAQGTAAKLRREPLTLGAMIDRSIGGRHGR